MTTSSARSRSEQMGDQIALVVEAGVEFGAIGAREMRLKIEMMENARSESQGFRRA
jgi:hypothetical protein